MNIGYKIARILMGAVACLATLSAQTSQPPGTSATLITPGSLPPVLALLNQVMGSRMTTPDTAAVTLTGTTTDASGSRSATIVIQAPGDLSYRESSGRAITFNGSSFQTSSGAVAAADEPIIESLLANFPDTVLLQALNGGGLRKIGSHYRTGTASATTGTAYAGPYWTVLAFAPAVRPGLAWEGPLQQEIFLAIDEKTRLPAEVRRSVQKGPNLPVVTQTQFLNWSNLNGQWFPGEVVRLESGKQTLSFQIQGVSTGSAQPSTAFQP